MVTNEWMYGHVHCRTERVNSQAKAETPMLPDLERNEARDIGAVCLRPDAERNFVKIHRESCQRAVEIGYWECRVTGTQMAFGF